MVQGDLYGAFFRGPKKRVQIYTLEEKKRITWHEPIDAKEAETLLQKFKTTDDTRVFLMPKSWKCKNCRFKGKWCNWKPRADGKATLSPPSFPALAKNLSRKKTFMRPLFFEKGAEKYRRYLHWRDPCIVESYAQKHRLPQTWGSLENSGFSSGLQKES